jgi:hypothetical protein
MACDKNQTYLQVRWVRDWTHLPASMFVIEFRLKHDLLVSLLVSDVGIGNLNSLVRLGNEKNLCHLKI